MEDKNTYYGFMPNGELRLELPREFWTVTEWGEIKDIPDEEIPIECVPLKTLCESINSLNENLKVECYVIRKWISKPKNRIPGIYKFGKNIYIHRDVARTMIRRLKTDKNLMYDLPSSEIIADQFLPKETWNKFWRKTSGKIGYLTSEINSLKAIEELQRQAAEDQERRILAILKFIKDELGADLTAIEEPTPRRTIPKALLPNWEDSETND